MIVCICKTISDKQIRKSFCNGNRTIEEVKEDTNACSQCGKCERFVQGIIDEELVLELIDSKMIVSDNSYQEQHNGHQ